MSGGGLETKEGEPLLKNFSDSFFGSDDEGLQIIKELVRDSTESRNQLLAFFTARATAEEEYSKKLYKISKMPLLKAECGYAYMCNMYLYQMDDRSTKYGIESMRMECENAAKFHLELATEIKKQVSDVFKNNFESQQPRRLAIQEEMKKLTKERSLCTLNAIKNREKYFNKCKELEDIAIDNSNAAASTPKTVQKSEIKTKKIIGNLNDFDKEYRQSVDKAQLVYDSWLSFMKCGLDQVQQLEINRYNQMRISMMTLSNLIDKTLHDRLSSVEFLRSTVETCNPSQDVTHYAEFFGTGTALPKRITYLQYAEEKDYSLTENNKNALFPSFNDIHTNAKKIIANTLSSLKLKDDVANESSVEVSNKSLFDKDLSVSNQSTELQLKNFDSIC